MKRYSEVIPKIFIDRDYLKQAVLNLLRNAVEALKGCPVKRLEIATEFDKGADAVSVSISTQGKASMRIRSEKYSNPTSRPKNTVPDSD